MDVIIKGINMPKNGEMMIAFASDENGENTLALILDANGKLIEHKGVTEIHTPHGRLIDADELLKAFEKACEQDGHWVDFFALVESAPTIIEAGENDEK